MPSHVARTRSAVVVDSEMPSIVPRARVSTNGARSPASERYGSTVTPCAPGGLSASNDGSWSVPTPTRASTRSSAAVPTIAGIARSQTPGVQVPRNSPAGSPSTGSSRVTTWHANVVPTVSNASPASVTPAPAAAAGRSYGPAETLVPRAHPVRVFSHSANRSGRLNRREQPPHLGQAGCLQRLVVVLVGP